MIRQFVFTIFPILIVRSSASCDPHIEHVNFDEKVDILVGSNRTFLCVIHSDTPLKEPSWTRQYGRSLPRHVISNGECPTSPNATCSNLTLLNVSQSDGSGYYTITAENECGNDNFTVNVEIETHAPNCSDNELPPLLAPPPPRILAVEGQRVTVTATYKGDYYNANHDLQAYWIIKNHETSKTVFVFPGHPQEGYNVTVEGCSVVNPFCCKFDTSVVLKSISLNQSGILLKSAACRSDLISCKQGSSTVVVYKRPTILESPNDTSISVGDSTQFICTYSASSNRHIVITRWSVNGKLIEKNTSHYALTTEYNYKYFNPDQVKSTLIISNATIDISGRYTCWCEYNESMIYGNKKITSSPSSVSLTIISSGHSFPLLIVIVASVSVLVLAVLAFIITFAGYCFYKKKRKHKANDSTVQSNTETTPLLGDQTSKLLVTTEQGKPLHNVASEGYSINTRPREEVDTLEIDGKRKLLNGGHGDTEGVNPQSGHGQAAADCKESLTQPNHTSPHQTGDATETVEEKHKRGGQDNSSSSQYISPTMPHMTAPTVPPLLSRLSTCEAIESKKDAPNSGNPAVASCEIKNPRIRPASDYGTNTHILNHIAVDFTNLVNMETLQPYLLAHQMLTNDETDICNSFPTKQNREILQFLKQKGSKTLQKLLCCLTKETTHSGHKTVATKLRTAMEMFGLNGKLFCPVCKKPISSNDKMISGQTSGPCEEGLTPSHQRSLQQPGSDMVTGAGNFQEEEHTKNRQHRSNSYDLLSPEQVTVSTTPSVDANNPPTSVSAPAGRDGRTFVREETSTKQSAVTERGDHISTSELIESVKEMPVVEKPALITQSSETTSLLESGTPVEFDPVNKVLNHIAVEFTKSINLEALVPRLMAHDMLTDAEVYICQSKFIPPSQKAQDLLKYLRHKGDEVLQKLLCCLNEEKSHPGHKNVATKLIEAMKFYKFDSEMDCLTCKAPKTSTSQEPEMLDEVFATITSKCPTEKWPALATALELSDSDIEHIKTLADSAESAISMVLQRWKQLHSKATKEELMTKLYHADFGDVVQ